MKRHVVLIVLLSILFLLSSPMFADDIQTPRPLKSIVAVYFKSDDMDDQKLPDELFKAFSARLPALTGAKALDLQSAISPAAQSSLGKDGIKKLLDFPELIGQTDRIRENIQADGLLLARVDAFDKIGKSYYASIDLTFYDFRNGKSEMLGIGPVDLKKELDKKEFYTELTNEVVRTVQYEVPGMQSVETSASPSEMVACNLESKLFHLPECHHLPIKLSSVESMTQVKALESGYKPCPICYPESRKGINPESTEAMLGAEVAGFIEYYYRVSNNPEYHARLERVGKEVLSGNKFTRRNYNFIALNSDEINAIAAPAGYIYVTTGMLDVIESDAELASVLGHEIAHVEEMHGVKQYRRAQNTAALGAIVSIFSGQDLSFLADFVRELVMRGYDRRSEREADRYGYMYLRRTKYDPEIAFTILGKLQDMEASEDIKIASWLRTHPKAKDRIKCVSEYKDESAAASKYIKELDSVDVGLAEAVRTNELRYVDSIDKLKAYVDTVKLIK